MEDTKKEHFVIKNLTEHSVSSIIEIFDKLKKGELNRHYAATFMNHSSSRSHTLFRITVKAVTNTFIRNYRQDNKGKSNLNLHHFLSKNHDEEEEEVHGTVVTESYLNFVDLAGSERIGTHLKNNEEDYYDDDIKEKTKNMQDSRVKEGRSINKSLFFLTQVISLKAEGKSNQYIPFRNSPLTKILRSSLGGNFRTLVVLCVNPCHSQIEISLSTLRFGVNAKKIQNSIKANILTNNNDESIKILIEQYERKMRDLQNQRDEDLSKYSEYVNIIEQLRLQRSVLLERLEQANKKLSTHITTSIPENDLFRFFRQAQTKMTVVQEAGLLFVPQNQSKYDTIEMDDVPLNEKLTLKKKFNEAMKTTTKEFVNKFALEAYNKVKAEFDVIKTTYKDHQNYLKQLCESFKMVAEFMAHLSSLGSVYLHKLHTMSEQYEDEYILAHERQLKLDLYEKYKGLSLLSDSDLGKMKDYLFDFRESIKSEIDRRDLLATGTKSLPEEAIEGLKEIYTNEKEDQESKLHMIKKKIESFVSFREGCMSEVDYYNQLNDDFKSKTDIDTRAKEIDEYISTHMADISTMIGKLGATFDDTNAQLKETEKKTLDKTVKALTNRYEKMVDIFLSGGKKSKPKEEKCDDAQSKESPDNSISPARRTSFLKKSKTINMEDDVNAFKDKDEMKTSNSKSINNWLTIRELDTRPLDYGSMIRDDDSVMKSLYGGIAQYMAGNNLATINEHVSHDDNVSERSFSVRHDAGGTLDVRGTKEKSKFTRNNTQKEMPERIEERKSYMAGGSNMHSPRKRPQVEERRSHVVGRSSQSPFTNDTKSISKKEIPSINKVDISKILQDNTRKLAGEDSTSNLESPRRHPIDLANPNGEVENDFGYSSCSSGMNLEGNDRKSHGRDGDFHRMAKSNIVENSPHISGSKHKDLHLNLIHTQEGIDHIGLLSPNSGINISSKNYDLSHRVLGEVDRERVSYKSYHNGRQGGTNYNDDDAISVDNLEIRKNEKNVISSKKNSPKKATLSGKKVTPTLNKSKSTKGHAKNESFISSPEERFFSDNEESMIRNIHIDIQPNLEDKKGSLTSTPLKQMTMNTTENGRKENSGAATDSRNRSTKDLHSSVGPGKGTLSSQKIPIKRIPSAAKSPKNSSIPAFNDKPQSVANILKKSPSKLSNNLVGSTSQTSSATGSKAPATNRKAKKDVKSQSIAKAMKSSVLSEDKTNKTSRMESQEYIPGEQKNNHAEEIVKNEAKKKPSVSRIKGSVDIKPASALKKETKTSSVAKLQKTEDSSTQFSIKTKETNFKSDEKPRTSASTLTRSLLKTTEPYTSSFRPSSKTRTLKM